jgi:hypothetical protein
VNLQSDKKEMTTIDEAFDKAIKEAGNGKYLDKSFMPDPASLIPDWNDSSEEVQSLVPAFKTY